MTLYFNRHGFPFRNVLMVFCLMYVSISFGQKYGLKGIVQDGEKLPLLNAVVMVLNPVDSVMIGYGMTDDKGSFLISNLDAKTYRIQITYIGFVTLEKIMAIDTKQSVLDMGVITMVQDGKILEAVTIVGEYIPVKVSKDTLEFNADAFKVQPNDVVEELLKRLPGVEVDASGGIKVQGEDVKAVTVDGKEFFGRDPKMATKNIPASAVKKVQIFDKKSKTSEFTGIDDGQDEKTINLELKDNSKQGYFGNVLAGYGTDQRFESRAMINRFSKKTQLSFIGSFNNLNNSGIDAGDYSTMTGTTIGFGGGRGGGGGRPNTPANVPITFGQSNTGLTESVNGGINLNHQFNLKTKININYYLTRSETDLFQSSLTNSFIPEGNLISNKIIQSNSNTFNHYVNTSLDLKIDSSTELNFIVRLGLRGSENLGTQKDTTQTSVRPIANINDQSKEDGTDGSTQSFVLNLRRKLHKNGRNISFDGSYERINNDLNNQLLSRVFGRNLMIDPSSSIFQDQIQQSRSNNYSLVVTYTEPLSTTSFLILTGSRRNNQASLIKDFYDLDPDFLTTRIFNEDLSRSFDNRFVYQVLGLTLGINKNTYGAKFGVDYQNSNLVGIPSKGLTLSPTFNYFLPKASLELDALKIRVNYSTSIREPSIDQLQPIVDNTDPINLYQGNPNLIPEYRHNVRITYNFFDQFNFISLFANVRLGYTANRITTATILDTETFIRTQTPLNTESEKTIAGNINYSSPLNVLKAKYRVGVNTSLTEGINFINLVENDIARWSNGFNVTIENKNKSNWDFSLGGRWNFNSNLYKNNDALNTSFVNQTYEASIAWFMGKGWTIDSRMEYNIFGQGSFDEATTVKLWQASVSKILHNRWTVKCRVFDILGQNQGVNRIASETFVSESISNTLGRYFMLSVNYSLTMMGKTNQSNTPARMHP